MRAQVDDPGIMEGEHRQHRQVRGHRHSYRTMAPEPRTRGMKASEHVSP